MTNVRVHHRQFTVLLAVAAVAAIAVLLLLAILRPISPSAPEPAVPPPTAAPTAEHDTPPIIAPCGRRIPC